MDILSDLCSNAHTSPYKMCEEIGLNRSAVAKWKNGSIPSGATLNKIADHFGVSVDYLLGYNKKEKLCVHFSCIRKFLGLSPTEMAKFLNRDLMTVYRWEQLSELPDMESLEKIANELNTTVEILLDKDPKNKIEAEEDGNLSFISYGEPIIINLQSNKNSDIVSTDKKKEKLTANKSNKPTSEDPVVNQIIEKLNGLSPELLKVALAQLDSLTKLQDMQDK